MPVFRKYDPIPTFTFHVEIDGVVSGLFTECEGLSFEREVVEHKEGGVNDFVHMLPGRVKTGTITLKRGVDPDLALLEWYNEGGINGKVPRDNVAIIIFNRAQEQIARFDLTDAFPSEYAAPNLKVDDVAPAVETLSIIHGGQSESPEGGEAGGGAEEEDDKDKDKAEIDLAQLAREVYALMRREARLERERLGWA